MTYRNAEGYPDPTAGEALANVYREQRAALWAQAIRKKHNDRPNSSRPPRSVQRARQKANKAKGRSGIPETSPRWRTRS